jgi:hypothetical protein
MRSNKEKESEVRFHLNGIRSSVLNADRVTSLSVALPRLDQVKRQTPRAKAASSPEKAITQGAIEVSFATRRAAALTPLSATAALDRVVRHCNKRSSIGWDDCPRPRREY